MTNYAVTGSSGFIGSHLINKLKEKGYSVRGIKRGNSSESFQISNIDKFANWKEVLSGIDVVFHCAGVAHIYKNNEYSKCKFKIVNEEGTIKLAKDAAKYGVKRLIFLSSIKVNGENTSEGIAFDSKSKACPQDSYALSKFYAEEKLKQISLDNELEIVIVRPPLVYGPGVGANFLKLIRLVNLKIPLPFSSLKNKRSVIFINNLVDFLIECSQNKKASGKTFLISDKYPMSTRELVICMANSLGFKPFLFFVPKKILLFTALLFRKKREFQKISNSLILNPKEAYEVLNWQPIYSTKKGIEETVNWYIKKSKRIFET